MGRNEVCPMWDRAGVQAPLQDKMSKNTVSRRTPGRGWMGTVGAKDTHDVEVARLLRE